MKRKICLFLLMITLMFSNVACKNGKIKKRYKIKGPSILLKSIKKILPIFKAKHKHLTLILEPVEDARAIASYLDGTCDFAIATRKFTIAERKQASEVNKLVQPYAIARDAVSVVVSKSNSIKDIDFEKLKRIFTVQISDWSEVVTQTTANNETSTQAIQNGASTPKFPSGKIEVCVLNNFFGMYQYFLNKLGIRYFSTKIKLFNTEKSLLNYVASRRKAIGLVSSVVKNIGCKKITINGIQINKENILNNKYPLIRTYYFFLPMTYNESEIIDFIYFFKSFNTRRHLSRWGFVRP